MKNKRLSDQGGYSAIEWFMVMGLLMLFSIAIFILAAASSNTYQQLIDEKETDTELRIATSYVLTKLKQNDEAETIQVVKRLDLGDSALMISETLLETAYETWIYWSNGALREATILKNGKLEDDLSFVIAYIDGFEVALEPNGKMQFKISKGDLDSRRFSYVLKTKQ